jgi:hypothetical protein
MDSEWWDQPAYESCLRRPSGLLGDEEYNYDVSQHASWPLSSPLQKEAEEEEISAEEYMPPELSKKEAILLAMEQSKLIELGQWEGLSVQLHASTTGYRVAPPPPPPSPPPPTPEPPVGYGHTV